MSMKNITEEKDMELINRLAKTPLTAEEVYTFKVKAADSQVDRDYEYFTEKTLNDLAQLYPGGTVIMNHDPKAENQTARIYEAWTEKDGEVTNLYCKAYMLREGNEDIIRKIDSGIIKEVSVGCAVRKQICSVCGKEYTACKHQKGRMYDGALCCAALDGAADAYEISFVAIPAQREAGVIKCQKSFSEGRENTQIKSALDIRLRAAKLHIKEIENENEYKNV